jgi:hypothetical protein
MSTTTNPPAASGTTPFPWPPPEFRENQAKMPLTELWTWAGKHVAWNWDGTHIVAGAATDAELFEELRRGGIDTSTVVFDYVDDPSVSWL